MNGKISFGVDFLHAMLETNERSKESNGNVLSLARVLLILEWGLTTQEQDEANKLFWKKSREKSLDQFSDVANRLIEHVKNVSEAKSKLLTDLILVTSLDGDLSDKEREFISIFAELLDFRPSEVPRLFDKAADIIDAFAWFATHNSFANKQN